MMCSQENSSPGTARFRRTFANRHVILPVIHVRSESQAWDNVQVARDTGADGAFLINHEVSSDELLDIHIAARRSNKRAIVSAGRTILTIAYQILQDRLEYRDLGANYLTRHRVRRLRTLGYDVTIQPTEEAA